MSTEDNDAVVRGAKRPHEYLLLYYAILSLILGPFFFVILIPLFFRYRTLRYEFDDEGVSMRWGLLFHREISLTYTRIQDIHLASNAVERYLGLARVQVQTASGTSKAEMTIEGLQEYDEIRDFLYSRMRGIRTSATQQTAAREPASAPDAAAAPNDPLATTLNTVAAEIAGLRSDLAARAASGGGSDGEPR